MRNKDNFKIDLMSSIDDDIIDKHTKKRFELISGKKSGERNKALVAIIALAACIALLASMLIILLPPNPFGQIPVTNPSGQTPVYQGMTVSNQAPTLDAKTPISRPLTYGSNISFLGKHNGNGDSNSHRPVADIVKDSLTVDTESEYLYYSKPGEDIYITVHINNPDEFEILSFTLNGVKYSSYMFEEGSDLENLVLKINVGDAEGIVEYTIDAIKYVDGTEIKDVLMEGDKTVSVAITPDAPTVEVTDVAAGISNIVISATLDDEKGLIDVSGEDYFAVICDNDTIVGKQIINSKDKTEISFEGLDPATTYRYAIVGVYDAIDGDGKCVHVLHEDEFTTQELVRIGDSYLDGADVCFDLIWDESYTGNKMLDTLVLYDGEDKLADLDVTTKRISNLPFDKEFTLVATYTYNDKQYETYNTLYSPKTSEGLELSYGSVVGAGSCSDTVLYINSPIADYAFLDNEHIKEVYLGNGAEIVERDAFNGCSNLNVVGISNGVKRIGENAFRGCTSLEAVYIGDIAGWCEIEFDDINSNPLSYAKNLYLNGDLVTTLTIPEGITSINRYAFNGCTSIENVIIPDSLDEYAYRAFIGCPNVDLSSFGVNNLIAYTRDDGVEYNISNTNEGTCFSAVASENSSPWLRVVSNDAVDLKKGVYMEIRVDTFHHHGDLEYFGIMLSDERYREPDNIYGEVVYKMINYYNYSERNWSYKEATQHVGEGGNIAQNIVDGKHYFTIELFWDEENSTFVYTINGTSAPKVIIDYMNGKWGGESSHAYVSFCLDTWMIKGGSVGCTLLKYGTSAEDATVPDGN